MRFYRNVRVHASERIEIPVVRSTPISVLQSSGFKSLLIAVMLLVFVTTIIVSIVLSKHTNNKPSSSSIIQVITTSNISPLTTSFSSSSINNIKPNLFVTSTTMSMNSVTEKFPEDNIANVFPSTESTMKTLTTATTILVPPNLLINPGAEEQFNGWIQTGSSFVIIDSSGDFNDGYYPHNGTYCFAGGRAKTGPPSKLLQHIELLDGIQGFTANQIDSGKLIVYISFYYQTWRDSIKSDDIVKVDVTFRTNSSDILSGIHTGELICNTSNVGWCHYTNAAPLPASARSIHYVMLFYKYNALGADINAYIDDNSLIIM